MRAMTRMAMVWALASGLGGTAAAEQPGWAYPKRPGAAAAAGDEGPTRTEGEVAAVTVYRGQAMVTREVRVPGPAGVREVVVEGLPPQVVSGSIYAEAARGVEVRSVRYRERARREDVREEVRELDGRIEQLDRKRQLVERKKKLVERMKSFLGALEDFSAPTAKLDLSRGVLDAEALKQLTGFIFDGREDLAEKEMELQFSADDLREKINTIQREKSQLTRSSSHTAREAVVFLRLKEGAGDGGRFQLRYLVENAGWRPSYNARANGSEDRVKIEYLASIRQMTGEDWTGVSMTLSTATPTLVATAPDLEPLELTLAQAGSGQSGQGMMMEAARGARAKVFQRQLKAAQEQRAQGQPSQARQRAGRSRASSSSRMEAADAQPPGGAGDAGGPVARGEGPDTDRIDRRLNEAAGKLEIARLLSEDRGDAGERPEEPRRESISVTYRLASRLTLSSRAGRQLIRIAELPMAAETYRKAVPVLTHRVYKEASVVNDGDRVLLAGPISSYVDGRFVGRGSIPTVASGERFTVGLGVDPSLRADRRRVDRTARIQGGNREVKLTYRLTISNFGDDPADVRLFDRIPSGRGDGLEVSLVNAGQPLSDAAAYRAQRREKGVLRWNVEVPPRSMGEDAKGIEYQYRLEYDKQKTIGGLAAGDSPATAPADAVRLSGRSGARSR